LDWDCGFVAECELDCVLLPFVVLVVLFEVELEADAPFDEPAPLDEPVPFDEPVP
jgi:hypothetical protein